MGIYASDLTVQACIVSNWEALSSLRGKKRCTPLDVLAPSLTDNLIILCETFMMRNWYNMEKIVVNFDNVDNSTGRLEIVLLAGN